MTITASASRLLKKLGEPVTLAYTSGATVDPVTGDTTGGTPVTVAAYGYPGRYMANEVDGSIIKSGDIRLTLEKISTRPQQGWDATVDGKTYRIMDVRPVRKSAADVIYICQIRAQ